MNFKNWRKNRTVQNTMAGKLAVFFCLRSKMYKITLRIKFVGQKTFLEEIFFKICSSFLRVSFHYDIDWSISKVSFYITGLQSTDFKTPENWNIQRNSFEFKYYNNYHINLDRIFILFSTFLWYLYVICFKPAVGADF